VHHNRHDDDRLTRDHRRFIGRVSDLLCITYPDIVPDACLDHFSHYGA